MIINEPNKLMSCCKTTTDPMYLNSLSQDCQCQIPKLVYFQKRGP